MLDLEAVRLFVLTVDCGNLTRAAAAAGTVQPVVSQKLKTLEQQLGRKLLDRTPRLVRLTAEGTIFLGPARRLLEAHDDALHLAPGAPILFTLGVSDHALGSGLEHVLRSVRQALPAHARIDVRSGVSQTLSAAFALGEFDAAIIRRESGGSEGEVLGRDPLGWRAGPALAIPRGAPVPLALLAPPCGVRSAAIRALDHAGRPWREAFVSGGCAALLAAARAGLGIAPMGQAASGELPDLGPGFDLPALPASEIVLFARTGSSVTSHAVQTLASAVRSKLF